MKNLAIAYAMKKRAQKKAMGGEMASGYEEMPKEHDEMNEAAEHEDEDMLSKILRKHYAEGGEVTPKVPHTEINDFDYLDTADLDDSTTNSGAADGDHLGNEQEDQDRHDIVAMVLKKRAKQHNPRPA